MALAQSKGVCLLFVCVCVFECVYKHPGLFVQQSGCWQRCLIFGAWITASHSPAEEVDGVQRHREKEKRGRGVGGWKEDETEREEEMRKRRHEHSSGRKHN